MRTVAMTRSEYDPSTLPEYTLHQGWYVYYLWLGPELVYVGKTTNLGQRITTHLNSPKRFDRVTYRSVDSKDAMRALEKSEIHRHLPRYNKTGVTADEYWAAHAS
jgi:excinuclease UvrABC nuclease subunit